MTIGKGVAGVILKEKALSFLMNPKAMSHTKIMTQQNQGTGIIDQGELMTDCTAKEG